MKDLNFSIPSPCSQDFSKMKKSEKGRYCDSCAKHVVDFSYKSKEEIIDYLVNKKDQEVCGTFRKEQLDRRSVSVRKRSVSFEFMRFLLFAFICKSNFQFAITLNNPRYNSFFTNIYICWKYNNI